MWNLLPSEMYFLLLIQIVIIAFWSELELTALFINYFQSILSMAARVIFLEYDSGYFTHLKYINFHNIFFNTPHVLDKKNYPSFFVMPPRLWSWWIS